MARKRKHERGQRGYHRRRTNTREPRQRFLIVCEGEQTEPAYFNSFRTSRVVITVKGTGTDPLDIVRKAHDMGKEVTAGYDQIWCVFDRDEWKRDQFTKALASASRQGIKVAYSNEAFELWYWLHFHYSDSAMGRSVLVEKLTKELGEPYRKNYSDMYTRLLPRQTTAIRFAERLLASHSCIPADANPSTTVHLLVQELNKHARP